MKLPPHIAWPAFIIALLLLGMGSSFGALIAARSDGGAQIIDDYYSQSVAWDSLSAVRQNSRDLGWRVDLSIGAPSGDLRQLEIRFTDREGMPVQGLSGVVRLYRPQYAAAVSEIALQETDTSGLFRLSAPVDRPGLWDFEVEASRAGARFQQRLRKEVLR